MLFSLEVLVEFWLEVINNVLWAVGDGQTFNFWNDIWLNLYRPLKDYYIGIVPMDVTLRVCDVMDNTGNWDWVRLRSWLPCLVLNYVADPIAIFRDAQPIDLEV